MAHSHDPHGDVAVVDRGYGAGLLAALAVLLVLAVVGIALLWSQPWDDDGGADTTPGIENPLEGGDPGTGGGTDDGGTGGGTDGGTDGGGEVQPPSGQ